MGIQDRAAARQVRKGVERRQFDPLLGVRGAHAGACVCSCASRVTQLSLALAQEFFALRLR